MISKITTPIYLFLACLLFAQGSAAQSVSITSLSPNPGCANATITVTFDRTGMPAASTETAELSDGLGSFGTPVVLGTYTAGGTSGSVTGTIPLGTAAGAGYLVRISSDYGAGLLSGTAALTINPNVGTPSFATATSNRCQGAGTVAYPAIVSNGTLSYSLLLSTPDALTTIDPATGTVTYSASFIGTATITATATGCGGPTTADHVVTVNPSVGTPSFTLGASSARCQGATTVVYDASAANNTGLTYSLAPLAAGSINTGTGSVDFDPGFSGTATITATAAGCGGPISADHIVSVAPAVGLPVFSALLSPTRCQGSGTESYPATAANTSGITYALAPGAAGVIDPATGTVTFASSFTGTATITASAAGCGGPLNADYVVTVVPTIGTPVFAPGPGTEACQGSLPLTYTATAANTSSISYSLAPPAAGSIDAATGTVTFAPGFSGTATITATATGCGGPLTANYVVTVAPTIGVPVFALGAASTRCQSGSTETYGANALNALGITYALSPAGAGTINTATGAVTFDAGFAGTATITATATGCGGPTVANHTVTVVGLPVFTAGPAASRCQGFGVISYPATSVNGTGMSYTLLTVPNDPTSSINSSTGTVTYSPSFVGTATITATTTGCATPLSSSFVVTVVSTIPAPSFALGAASIRCQGGGNGAYSAASSGSTGITYSILPSAAGSIDGAGTVSFDPSFSGIAIVTASAAGCGGPFVATHTITVTPTVGTPVFAAALPTRCQGAGTVTYTASASNNTGISYSLSPSGAGTINTGTGAVSYAATFAGTAVITASANGCNGPVINTFSVVVTPTVGTPVFALGATSTRCQGAQVLPYTATATDNTGILYSVGTAPPDLTTTINPISGALTFSSGFTGVATITATASGCNGPKTATHTVTTVGTPVFALGATSTRCQGGGTASYTASSANGTVSYSVSSIPFNAGISVNSANGDVTFSPDFAGTVKVTASGCGGANTAEHNIIVNATPHIYTLSDSMCGSSSPNSLLLSTTPNSTFTWNIITPLAPPLALLFTPSPGSGNRITHPVIFNNSDNQPGYAQFRVVTSYTSNSVTCAGVDTFTLKVKHRPSVTTSSSFMICSGQNTNIQLSASDPNATFTWSTPQNHAVTVNGNINNGTTCNLCNQISQVLADTGINTGNVIYTASAEVGGCRGGNTAIAVQVNPKPIITFPRPNASFSICSEKALSIALLDTPGVGTTSFYWSRITPSGVTAFNSPFGSILRDSLVFPSTQGLPADVNYTLYDTSGFGCAATPVQILVKVYPKPIFTNVITKICHDVPTNILLSSSTGTGTTYSWNAGTADPIISNNTAGSGSTLIQTLRNSTDNMPGNVVYTVNPISAAPASCIGNPGTVTIRVDPQPMLKSDTVLTVCSDSLLRYDVVSSTGVGSTYTYDRNSPAPSIPFMSITTPTPTTTPIVNLLSSNYELTPRVVTYAIELESAEGCKSDNQRLTVTVNPTPDAPGISIFPQTDLCANVMRVNFGAARQPHATERYTWSGPQVMQLLDSTRFALISFPNDGAQNVSVYSKIQGYSCRSVLSSMPFNVSRGNSSNPNVVMFTGNLVCQGAGITRYQWGFDRKSNLDSQIIPGIATQNLLIDQVPGFDLTRNYYWVMATYADGCVRKAYYNEPPPLAAGALKAAIPVRVYPNPVQDQLIVEVPDAAANDLSIRILDITGKELIRVNGDGAKTRISAAALLPGYYLVECSRKGERLATSRFIKQ